MRVLLAGLLLVLFAGAACGQAPLARPVGGPVVVVLAYDVTWEDLLSGDCPTLRGMAEQGAVGLLCCRTAAEVPDPASAALTIGAGARVGLEEEADLAGLALCANEGLSGRPAADAYQAWLGSQLGSAQVAYLGGQAVTSENLRLGYRVRLGALGEAVRAAGLGTAVLGNADLPALPPHRYAVSVAMDAQGVVPFGDVGQECLLADDGPAGVRTNYGYLLARLEQLAPQCGLLVVETGDTDRLSRLSPRLSPTVRESAQATALARLDEFLANMLPVAVSGGWRVLLLSTGAGLDGSPPGLQPALLWGHGVRPGLLGSPSTRRPDLGTTVDVAPTVLNLLRVTPPPGLVGRPLEVTPRDGQVAYVRAAERRQQHADAVRPALYKLGVALIIVLLVFGAVVLLVPGWSAGWGLAARVSLVFAGWLPVVMLAWSLALPLPAGAMIAGVLCCAVMLTCVTFALETWLPLGLLLPGVTAGVVLVDMLAGSRLDATSAFGYAAAEGARFYGIGNEYGGLLLGSVILLAALAGDGRRWQPIVGTFGLLITALLCGLGPLGANFGICLAMLAGAAAFSWYGSTTGRPLMLGGTLVLAAMVVAAVVLPDLHGDSSHIGRAAVAAEQSGWGSLADIAGRKLAMNIKLVRYSDWLYALLAGLAAVIGPALLRPAQWAAFAKERPACQLATRTLVVAAVAGFALNDSGLLAAALALVMGAVVLGVEQLRRRGEGHTSQSILERL